MSVAVPKAVPFHGHKSFRQEATLTSTSASRPLDWGSGRIVGMCFIQRGQESCLVSGGRVRALSGSVEQEPTHVLSPDTLCIPDRPKPPFTQDSLSGSVEQEPTHVLSPDTICIPDRPKPPFIFNIKTQ